MSHIPFLRVELLIFLKLQITIICLEEYVLFVNYVLDLNNGLEQRLFRVVWTTTMKRTKLRKHQVHCLLQVLPVIIYVIGFSGLPRLILFHLKQHLIMQNFFAFTIFCNFSFGFVIQGTWVSMGVCSDGSYGIEPGLIYSFLVKCENGKWSIVQGKFCRASKCCKCHIFLS